MRRDGGVYVEGAAVFLRIALSFSILHGMELIYIHIKISEL